MSNSIFSAQILHRNLIPPATNLVTSSTNDGWVSVQLLCKTVTPLGGPTGDCGAHIRQRIRLLIWIVTSSWK
jgi:hypothetical protein